MINLHDISIEKYPDFDLYYLCIDSVPFVFSKNDFKDFIKNLGILYDSIR